MMDLKFIPNPPRCGVASPNASQSFGMAMRTFSCEEQGLRNYKCISPSLPKRGGQGVSCWNVPDDGV
jgi:hypothetical protein